MTRACMPAMRRWTVYFNMKTMTQEEIDSLQQISVSQNVPGGILYQEHLPKILFGIAPRVVKGAAWFDKYSERRRPMFGEGICETCHLDMKKTRRLDRHETYGLYKHPLGFLIIKLENVMHICPNCHQAIHHGNTMHRVMKGKAAMPQLLPMSPTIADYYLWNRAEFLLIENELYPILELRDRVNQEDRTGKSKRRG